MGVRSSCTVQKLLKLRFLNSPRYSTTTSLHSTLHKAAFLQDLQLWNFRKIWWEYRIGIFCTFVCCIFNPQRSRVVYIIFQAVSAVRSTFFIFLTASRIDSKKPFLYYGKNVKNFLPSANVKLFCHLRREIQSKSIYL